MFQLDDSAGTARNLLPAIDGEEDVVIRSGPTLQRRTRGGDAGARYVDDAPRDIQIDIPVIPMDEDTTGTIAVVLANRTEPRTLDFQVESGTNRGIRVSGEVVIDEITMTYRNGEGQAGFVIPLKQSGSPLTITNVTT